MNEEKGYSIYCPRCGAEMNSNSRYCMKCGNLNYDHDANKNMRPFIENQDKQAYQVGSGTFISQEDNKSSFGIANNTGSQFVCFLITFLMYVLLTLGLGYLFFVELDGDITSLMTSAFPLFGIIISLSFLYLYSLELIYIKCNQKWWSGIIPIYNYMVLSDILFKNKLLGLITLIPIIGPIFIIILHYKLGKDFNYNGILVALFPIIFLPLMAFGNHTFRGQTFITDEGKISIEKAYRYKKIFLITFGLVMISLIGSMIYANRSKISEVKPENYYYVLTANKMIKHTKKEIESGANVCGGNYSPNSGVYYFTYYDVGDLVHLPFYFLREPIEGYVKVDNTTGSSVYSVSLSDGKLGFGETPEEFINKDVVVESTGINMNDLNISCAMNK